MSSIAIAQGLPRRSLTRPQAPRRRNKLSGYVVRPWAEVPLSAPLHVTTRRKSWSIYAWGLIVVAVAFHAGFVWFVANHSLAQPAALKHELAVDFVTPPKPPEPKKIDPPKPPPPPKHQVLPPIEQAPPDSSFVAAPEPAEPPVAVAPSAPPAPPAPEPVIAAFGRAGYLNNPEPGYPAMAVRQGWQGTVILRVHVLSTGKPDIVEVQKSSGHTVLDEEAVRTVKSSWSYTPAKRGSTPVDGWTTTPIEFRLDS
ncbi:MAG: energy transducer TonB [Solimonas sp.]